MPPINLPNQGTDPRLASAGALPIVVKPKAACLMLSCGIVRLYELLNTGQLESFLDGRSRKITVRSIEAYVARKLAAPRVAA